MSTRLTKPEERVRVLLERALKQKADDRRSTLGTLIGYPACRFGSVFAGSRRLPLRNVSALVALLETEDDPMTLYLSQQLKKEK